MHLPAARVGRGLGSRAASFAKLLFILALALTAGAARAQTFTQNADVGAVGAAGGGSYASGTYSVNGAGPDIGGAADAFHFTYVTLSGDGQVIARLASLTTTAGGAVTTGKAGIMIRESLAAGSVHAAMLVTPASGALFQRRTATGAASTPYTAPNIAPPRWLKLVRTGNSLIGFVSPDGTKWQYVWSDTVPMAAVVYAGLAATSSQAGAVVYKGTLDNASMTPGTVSDTGTPAAPGSLTLADSSDSWAKLTWQPSFDDVGVQGYDIYRGGTKVGTVPGYQTFYVDGTLTPATAYTFTVKAFDLAPPTNHVSAASNSASVTTLTATLPSPWKHQDVGTVTVGGTATQSSGTFTIGGEGTDIAVGETADG